MSIIINTNNDKISYEDKENIIKPDDKELFFILSSCVENSACSCCKNKLVIEMDDKGYININDTLKETIQINKNNCLNDDNINIIDVINEIILMKKYNNCS